MSDFSFHTKQIDEILTRATCSTQVISDLMDRLAAYRDENSLKEFATALIGKVAVQHAIAKRRT